MSIGVSLHSRSVWGSWSIRLIKWMLARLSVNMVTYEGASSRCVEECMRAAARAESSARVMVLVFRWPPGMTVRMCKGLLWV